ncbi:hypothetical protein J2X16_003608 [Pelomonas aquatica]|uniref:Restriction endonuclease type IV Mrr domain-containing protein n=1 Tax=Pelomonas aquatica TaxID=431058 RepID=A0ABU1ZE43_9BURK|nr:hypothetical protein [Pelomonas aquatica]MDR7298245.1 hypothetical protein [Pelomonas aquatica]
MTFATHTEEQINTFCAQLAPVEQAFISHAALGYCALRRDDRWFLYSARLRLDSTMTATPATFKTSQVIAGRIPIDTRSRPLRKVIEELLGTFAVIDASIHFEADENGSYSAYAVPHHRSAGERSALATLKIRGGRAWERVDFEEIGWRLRGSEIAFESLAELCAECDTGDEPGSLEIVAAPVMRILSTSTAKQNKATVMLSCPGELEVDLCRLAYRVIQGSTVVHRDSIAGKGLNWRSEDGIYVTTHDIDIPEGALVDCAVSYQGETHQQAWITDRSAVGNPRRAAFEPSDTELLAMQSMLRDEDDKNGRGFEAAVAWLFWMLGFNPAHLRNSKQHEDAPDILVECEGDFVIVECTIGQLKADKRSNLKARCVNVEKSLAASGNRDAMVLPVLVTRFSHEQVTADLDDAAKAGLHVLTRDDMLALMERTRQINSPAVILAEWRTALEANRAATQRPQTPAF